MDPEFGDCTARGNALRTLKVQAIAQRATVLFLQSKQSLDGSDESDVGGSSGDQTFASVPSSPADHAPDKGRR